MFALREEDAMRKLIMCVMAVAAVSVAGCGSTLSNRRATSAAGKGDQYLLQGDYQKAQETYEQVLGARPTAEAALKQAYCLKKAGELSASMAGLARSADLGMNEARALLALYGEMTTGEIQEFVRTHESNPYGWAALGNRHFEEANYGEAAECYETALKHCKDAVLRKSLSYNLSIAYLKDRQFADARSAFDSYLGLTGKPVTHDEHLILGLLSYAEGDHAGAAEAWSRLPEAERKEISATLGRESQEYTWLASD